MKKVFKVGFGGGCHWCTEAVFMALKGVEKVEQGYISPKENPTNFSEAVIVHYFPGVIELKDLVAVHLDTHRSTENHSMRNKYRSGIYYFKKSDKQTLVDIINEEQQNFDNPLITAILPFGAFKSSEERFHRYYFNDMEKPFCKTHIAPKIKLLKEKYAKHLSSSVL
ncbi:peptide-methionine (S)-S-oxide reductase [Maribacter hydrothermalis]|uniref:peptide-methionine (S)-S-oxide reductase n=1 Tax=Maribacter hydrothermalis TaxID=1836467 RepID=A0A1B7ZC14_9FLAO|nr:peptide-methionine (S)-S-oxide reductase [Maribacter hydrothermalis]APQ16005.1 peptide methionine sulfoxide reductase [Maribacter hydrothermalis]OBR40422.1 peptide methionine sulfoxide reductase [Maribacter hydrothermalis]